MAATKSAAALYAAAARLAGLVAGGVAVDAVHAAALPEDRADLMYHRYSGGGVTASGPAFEVRKNVADIVSLTGSYYVDSVTSASIDVVTTASPYQERRIERGLGVEYAYRDALLSFNTSRSTEPDYTANRNSVDLAQDVFGGMTTIKLGYTRGHDTVGQHGAPAFSAAANHWQYRFGATQVLSPRWIASANYEAISDDGYLGSPYRVARVLGAAVPERMPGTRSSRAAAFRSTIYVDPRISVHAEYRRFWDNWGVRANTFEAGYSTYFEGLWMLDAYVRYYKQGDAVFYSDNFRTEMNYMTRNRQLSSFHDFALGGKASYTAYREPGRYEIKFNAAYEWMRFKYSDFTDIRNGSPYTFDAHVLELFVSGTF